MEACPRGHIAACELLHKLLITTTHDLVSHVIIKLPSASPRSARSVFPREVADPAVRQYLTVTGAQIRYLICDVCSFGQANALMDTVVTTCQL